MSGRGHHIIGARVPHVRCTVSATEKPRPQDTTLKAHYIPEPGRSQPWLVLPWDLQDRRIAWHREGTRERSLAVRQDHAWTSWCRACGLEPTMPIRLVLAETYPIIRTGRQHLFQQEDGCQVVACCRHGEAMLQAVHPHHPDVLVLDRRIPSKDGWAVFQALTQAPLSVRVVSGRRR